MPTATVDAWEMRELVLREKRNTFLIPARKLTKTVALSSQPIDRSFHRSFWNEMQLSVCRTSISVYQDHVYVRIHALQQVLVIVQKSKFVVLSKWIKEFFIPFVGGNKKFPTIGQHVFDVFINLFRTYSSSLKLKVASSNMKWVKFPKLFAQGGNNSSCSALNRVFVANVIAGVFVVEQTWVSLGTSWYKRQLLYNVPHESFHP